MELVTAKFGPVQFTLEDVILFSAGLLDAPGQRRWLLLSDRRHAQLWWLQSLDSQALAIPVVALARPLPSGGPRVTRSVAEQLDVGPSSPTVVLVPLRRAARGWRAETARPILINPQRRIGRQVDAHAQPSSGHLQ